MRFESRGEFGSASPYIPPIHAPFSSKTEHTHNHVKSGDKRPVEHVRPTLRDITFPYAARWHFLFLFSFSSFVRSIFSLYLHFDIFLLFVLFFIALGSLRGRLGVNACKGSWSLRERRGGVVQECSAHARVLMREQLNVLKKISAAAIFLFSRLSARSGRTVGGHVCVRVCSWCRVNDVMLMPVAAVAKGIAATGEGKGERAGKPRGPWAERVIQPGKPKIFQKEIWKTNTRILSREARSRFGGSVSQSID